MRQLLNSKLTEPINTGGAYIETSELINADFETILEESGLIHPQTVYTSRSISLKELVTINSQAVCTNEFINDDNQIIENQENNKIIESQEDNILIERMNKLMLEIEKDKATSVRLSCE
ncbi:35060_t:CDS:2 [Gigaspora margarita]|uniref:35060_t:CDS:1 n=1 Tax=Gigaspora margarita TaxID=4874 RepID=A0ABN7VQN9_GIGMA|nr:35060_t:CDS:2 [Gigaspora margarita]